MNHKEIMEKVANLSLDDFEMWEERAAIMEFDGGLPREKAEIEAYKCLLDYKNQLDRDAL
jgi:hypothetical protein